MWKNIVERGRPQVTIWRIACWIPKATNTHTDCVILLFHYNNGCTNAPHCYVIRTLLVLCCNYYENVNIIFTVSSLCFILIHYRLLNCICSYYHILSTAQVLSYNALLSYTVSIILILFNFSKRNIRAPCRWFYCFIV